MTKVHLDLQESQVVALVRQLSPEVKQTVLQMLATELGEPDEPEALADEDGLFELWDEEELWGEDLGMDRRQLLAAETHAYSYANYDNHLGIGNVRFDRLMPDNVDTLERAEREGWDDVRLAQALEVSEEHVDSWRESYRRAKEIVDAPTPAESFRRGVRYSIQDAVEKGLADVKSVEQLATQICYRAADLAYLLDLEGSGLSGYSSELRQSPELDLEDLTL